MEGEAGNDVGCSGIASWLEPFRTAFTTPTWRRVLVLTSGAILSPGRRTVCSALRAMGLEDAADFSSFHRVLNCNRWNSLALARVLFVWLVSVLVPDGPVIIGIDDTLERRTGRRISARGIYRDPVRSSRGHFVKASGLRWQAFMLLAPLSWTGRVWGLPFLTLLCPSERYARERGTPHRKLTDRARQGLLQIARWLPGRKIIAVTDSSHASIDLLNAVRDRVCVVSRLHLDARLFDHPPPRTARTLGRPRRIGERQASLASRLENPDIRWNEATIGTWYGGQEHRVEFISGTALWHNPGRAVPVRYVLVRDPAGRFRPQAFLCTDLAASPADILTWFVRRWSMEVTFAETRPHLGIETQRQWSDLAIARTTPVLMGLFSVITLVANGLQKHGGIRPANTAWYRKEAPTFSDAIAAVRRELWAAPYFHTSPSKIEQREISLTLFNSLMNNACYAA
jgi:DDE superfamily endonuclease